MVALYEFARGPREGPEFVGGETLVQEDFDLRSHATAPDTSASQSRVDNSRIVQHQTIAWEQQTGQIANGPVRERAFGVYDQQPCGIARHRWPQCDPFFRQDKVKLVDAHRKVWPVCKSSPSIKQKWRSDTVTSIR